YFRLNAFHIHIPPLREMREDIPALITFLLQSVTSKTTTAYHKFIDPFVEKILIAYEWPGNVRELKNVLEHSSILADGDNISVDDLPPEIRKTHKTKIINDEVDSLNGDLRHMIHQFELSILTKAVKEASGDRRLAAQRLGIGLSSLYRKLEELEQRDSHSI
ncbi:MAG: sigma-54-dependent Fis family transcriptional regulator, partial [Pseudomonadota bacterium]|nr:sigma-54-dependent Fis family transcriptional regulator [Pseudomonadota bacterium]